MPTPAELQALLEAPVESIAVEYKSWLDFTENRDRATLAKAAIALANSGGGIIVLGMRARDGGGLASQPAPAIRCTTDAVNSAINRYADPELHCDLVFATHPTSNSEHAFVVVPGGHAVPIMANRECEGVIASRRCYVRKPGPRSEEPHGSEEWRQLLDRCVRAGRDQLLDAIRIIVHGQSGRAPLARDDDELLAFVTNARERWQELVDGLPQDNAARFPHGGYHVAAQLRGVPRAPTLAELRRRLDQAGQVRHTGWGPFVQLHRNEFEPLPVDGAIQAWLGNPNAERFRIEPAHCDFWRADPTGLLFLYRGFDEDGFRPPGSCLDITLPVWRVGEVLLYISRLADTYGDEWSVVVNCRYYGLRGRVLTSLDNTRLLFDDARCADDEAVLTIAATRQEIQDNLVEVLHKLLSPLYERFRFFELSQRLVTEEVQRMIRGRF